MPITGTPAGNPDTCNEQLSLPGSKKPSPVPVSCVNQKIISPRTPTESTTGDVLLARTRAIEIPGAKQATIEWTMHDPNGIPVDLSNCLCDDGEEVTESGSSESVGSEELGSESLSDNCDYCMVFRMGEYLTMGGCPFKVRVFNAAEGRVAVDMTPKDTQRPGIYFGEFALVEKDDEGCESVIFSNNFYIIIGRNLWQNHLQSCQGPPTITEVRLHLRDTDPAESFLLDNLAFGDEEIAQALSLPVQYWNEVPPPLSTYTTQNFPYRYHWLMATAGHLFLTVAEQQRRNNLQYAAGGVQVNDQSKELPYEQAAQRRLEEWRNFVRVKKAEINLSNAWGGIGSSYSNY